jgi:hypothetical protein
MLRPYKYVEGEEVKDYLSILKAKDGFIVVEKYQKYAIDQGVILAKTVDSSMERLNSVLRQGAKVYIRNKVYREPVFSKEVDEVLDSWLSQFAYDYSDNEFSQDELMEDKLVELKKIIGNFYILSKR